MTVELQLELLGGLRITQHGAALTTFVSGKAPALLGYLAVTGRPHFRAALARPLWNDQGEGDARHTWRIVPCGAAPYGTRTDPVPCHLSCGVCGVSTASWRVYGIRKGKSLITTVILNVVIKW